MCCGIRRTTILITSLEELFQRGVDFARMALEEPTAKAIHPLRSWSAPGAEMALALLGVDGMDG